MNTCPVFRRSGGYSYEYVVPGPIGALLATARDPRTHGTLPFASTLCGSCDAVCPVKIDLHEQLLTRRRDLAHRHVVPLGKRVGMRIVSWVLRHRPLYEAAGRISRALLRVLPRGIVYGPWNAWGRRRELPPPPPESFRDAWRRTRGSGRG
jgi:L-lactate dehydrogenase complex protein LldF